MRRGVANAESAGSIPVTRSQPETLRSDPTTMRPAADLFGRVREDKSGNQRQRKRLSSG